MNRCWYIEFCYKVCLANLNSDNADKLYIDQLKNVPNNLSNLKNKFDKLHFGKFETTPVDLSTLSNVVNMMLLKRLYMILNAIQTTDIINLVKETEYNRKFSKIEEKLLILIIAISILLHKNLIK